MERCFSHNYAVLEYKNIRRGGEGKWHSTGGKWFLYCFTNLLEKKVKSQMVRSVPGLDKCDGGGKWLPLDTSHQLLRQCRGQDKQNGTRTPRHRGRGWIVEFLIRGGAGETERRVAPMGRGAPRAPRGSNWTHRPSERIVGGGGGENQLLSDCEHVSIVSILFEYCEYCEIVKAGGWV